jgi:diguanylate cyclase (GGDEF)-like protein
MIIEMLRNSVLLFALIFIYGAMNFRPNEPKLLKNIIAGLLIAFFTIAIMMNPWFYDTLGETKIFYDTRSVILSVAGAFFSPIATLIAIIAASSYRIYVGGIGAIAGVLSIVTSGGIGILWRYLRRNLRPKLPIYVEFFLIGLIVHIIVILCQLALPWPVSGQVISSIALPYLTLYPFVTAIMAVSIQNQIDRLDASEKLRKSKVLLQASLESPQNLIMCSIDHNFNYLAFNQSHIDFLDKEFGTNVLEEKNFLIGLGNQPDLVDKMRGVFNDVLKGQSLHLEYRCRKCLTHKILDVALNPIRDDHHKIIGISMFGQDITEDRRREEEILHISYHDFLTGLYNRRFLSEYINQLNDTLLPMTFVIADINGLKLANDAFGHYYGDDIIVNVAKTLSNGFRSQDVLCRSGGDEFIIAMPNTARDQALKLIELIKNEFNSMSNGGLSVSVSFGVDTMNQLGNVVASMKQAEIEMYRNKLFESTSDRSETIKAILSTLYVKNPREESHSRRVSDLCALMGEKLKMGVDAIKQLRVIGNLHDIGKIAIDETILNKPGKLSKEEWIQIKRHPEIGYRILAASTDYAEMAEDILCHHERWDGTGYPKGIKGETIPLRARIIALADAYDAMTEKRTYRPSLSKEEAIQEIEKYAGTQFDPTLSLLFIEMIKTELHELSR